MLDLGRFTYISATTDPGSTPFKIEVEGKIYTVNANSVLRNELGIIEDDTISEIWTRLYTTLGGKDNAKVFDIAANANNEISSFKYVALGTDKAKAKTVIDMIDALGSNPTKAAVEAARKAYDGTGAGTGSQVTTTLEQRNLVTNVAKLVAAEAKLVAADKAVEQGYVDADKAALTIAGDLNNVTANLLLAATGASGKTDITWASDKAGVVAIDGTVTQPSLVNGDETVKLTATIASKADGTVKDTKEFTVVVKAAEANADDAIAAAKAELTIAGDLNNVTADLTLPLTGAHGTTVAWASDNTDIVAADGTVVRPAGANVTVKLTATITKAGQTVAPPVNTKVFYVTVLGE